MSDDGELFRRTAEQAVEYRRTIGERPQRPAQTYVEAAAAWEAPTPEVGEAGDKVIAELTRLAAPGLHAMTGPRFHGWVIGGSHPVGVAADWLTSTWGQNVGNHHASPAGAAAEAVAEKWLLDLLGLPERSSVGFVTGATVANFVCLAAARGEVLRRAGWDVERKGLFGAPPVTVMIGEEAHATVFSALQFLGFGHDRPVRIAVDDQGAMRPEALGAALDRCQGAAIVVTQAARSTPVPSIRWLRWRRSRGQRAPGSMSTGRSACGPGPARHGPTWRRGWNSPIPGRPTGTSGCKRRTIAATPSCAIPRRIVGR